MNYILKDGIYLHGYQLLPYVIVKIERGKSPKYAFLDKRGYELLSLCEGKIDFDLPIFSDEQRKFLTRMKDNGFIEESNTYKKIEYVYHDNRLLKTIHWSITGRCNSKCKHCYMAAPDAKYGELDKETIFKIIDDMVSAGVFNVTLTGGECLVRKDFFEIVDKLLDNNINIQTVYSNGFLVNEKLLNEFKKRNIYPEFNMSFDGVGYHDYMRGIDGAEKMTDEAFIKCHEMGFPTGAEMCIFSKNKHTLRETVNHLAKMHVRSLKTNPVYNSNFWKMYGDGIEIGLEELYDLYLDYIPHYYEDKKPLNIMLGGFFYASKSINYYMVPMYKKVTNIENTCVCGHARNVMYISAEGRALPCMSLSDEEVQKNFPIVQEIGLKKCLSDSYYMKFIDTTAKEILDRSERCKNCEYAANCLGGCRASAYSTSKEGLYGIDEYACAIFKRGYLEKIDKAVKINSNEEMLK